MYTVDIQNAHTFPLDQSRLRAAVVTVFTQQRAPADAAATVVVTDDASAAALNLTHRGIDAATDVLSFPAGEPPVHIPDEPPYMGDIVIAFGYASAQAERAGHVTADSFALLAVHGALHLLGFDHDTPARRVVMWEAQAQALAALGIPLDYVPALEAGEKREDDDDFDEPE